MRRFLVPGSLVLGGALLAPASWAGDYDLSIGIGRTVPTGILSDSGRFNLDGSVAVSGALVGPLSGRLHWRAEVGYDDFAVSESDCAGAVRPDICILLPDLKVTRFSGGLQVASARTSGLSPFAYLTGGLYHVDTSSGDARYAIAIYPSPLRLEEDSANFFGVGLGAGAEWPAGEHWSVGGEVRVNGYFVGDHGGPFPRFDDFLGLGFKPDPSSHWYITPTLFITLKL